MRSFLLPPFLFYTSVGVMVAAQWFGFLMIPFPPLSLWIGLALIALGLFLAFWGKSVFKRHETNIATFDDPDVLVADGPFRFTRNPMYVGMIMALTGVFIVTGSAVGVVLIVSFLIVTAFIYIPYEEDRMRHAFGRQYQKYSGEVRRWL